MLVMYFIDQIMSTPLTEEQIDKATRYCPYGTYQRATSGYSIGYMNAHKRFMIRCLHSRLAEKSRRAKAAREARHRYIRSGLAWLASDVETMRVYRF
jgi:hypothetical protein